MISVFKREFKSLFCGYRAYSFMAIFALCYLAVRMVYNYLLLYDKTYGLLNQEYILVLLPAAFALAVPVITFSMFEEERRGALIPFLRSLPLTENDLFLGKCLSRVALLGVVYSALIIIDVLLGFYSGAPAFTLIYSIISYLLISFLMLALNIFLACACKNKFIALGVGYGINAILITITIIRYVGSRTFFRILEPMSIFGTYSTAVFGVLDLSYVFLWISLCGLFAYLSYVTFKKEFRF